VAENILNAYYFLCQNYSFPRVFSRFRARKRNPSTPEESLLSLDEIILVGFSRGGFTVRCLASFINRVGLLRRRGLAFMRTLFSLWERQDPTLDDIVRQLEGDRDSEGKITMKNAFLVKTRIRVLAEWDTVSAMATLSQNFHFVNDTVPDCVDYAFHALALNETRRSFVPMLYTKAGDDTKVLQCGFVGCHSDIGGGNEDAGLSTLSLIWMISAIESFSKANFDRRVMLGDNVPLAVELQSYSRHEPKHNWLGFRVREEPQAYKVSGEPGEEKHVILDYRRERLYTEGREAAKALAAEITCAGYHH
jgi:hypothetical protein